MAIPMRAVQGPDLGQLLGQSLGTYKQVKGIQADQAKEDRTISAEFAQERAETAAQMRGKSTAERITILNARISRLKDQGKDPQHTQRLLDMYQAGTQVKEADAIVDEAYNTGVIQGRIKEPAKEKIKEQYRMATPEEKQNAGITDKSPYQISPQGKFLKVSTGKGQNINVNVGGAGEIGTIPPGYAVKKGAGGQYEMYEIKGGPVEKKTEEGKKKTESQRKTTARTANIVKEDIGRFRALIEDQKFYDPVTGPTGSFASNVPGSARKDAEALKNTIGANVGFDRLQAMREASKTGGALGAISEREMKQLEAVMGSIELSQSGEQLSRNLDRLEKIYDGIIKKAGSYPNAEQYGFGGVTIPNQQIQTPTQEPTPEQLQRYQ